MNEELIKTLYAERKRLYPNGCPIAPRGCGKTFLYMSHFLMYTAYDFMCDIYKCMGRKVTLEEAHNDMEYYVNKMWEIIKEGF